MRKKRLPWNLDYLGHSPMPTIIQSPYSFAQTVSSCVKPSYQSSHPRTFSIPNSISSISSSMDPVPVDPIIIATDTTLPISLSSSIQIINETIRDAPPIHERVAAVYKHRRGSRDVKQITNRKYDVLVARLRSGHHPSLKQYLHRLDPSQDPTCPNCRQEEQDLVHWLRDCPALLSVRQRVFRCHQGSLEWLASRPGMKWRTQGRPWSALTPNPITTNG